MEARRTPAAVKHSLAQQWEKREQKRSQEAPTREHPPTSSTQDRAFIGPLKRSQEAPTREHPPTRSTQDRAFIGPLNAPRSKLVASVPGPPARILPAYTSGPKPELRQTWQTKTPTLTLRGHATYADQYGLVAPAPTRRSAASATRVRVAPPRDADPAGFPPRPSYRVPRAWSETW